MNQKHFHTTLFCLVLWLFNSCIDPFETEIKDAENLLIVEGYLATLEDQYLIRLRRSDRYGSIFDGLIRPETRAEVGIRNSKGEVTELTEIVNFMQIELFPSSGPVGIDLEYSVPVRSGFYVTPENFKVELNESYSIQIKLRNGEEYSSLPERVRSVPELESLSIRNREVITDNPDQQRFEAQVLAHWQDPGDQVNFYHWRYREAIYKFVANPELYTPPRSLVPAPKDCCEICYRTDDPNRGNIVISDDETFNGLSTSLPVASIQDDGYRFKDTYRIDIDQLSLSPEAYRFLRLIRQQLSIDGSVFDPPPAFIRSNVLNVKDPDEMVLGYFFVSDVSRKRLYIKREDLDFPQPLRIFPDDCRVQDNTQLEPPEDWDP